MRDSKPYNVFVLLVFVHQAKGNMFYQPQTVSTWNAIKRLKYHQFYLTWEFAQNIDTLSVGAFEQRQHAV